ncbi:MAG: methyltransferase domain-containing protein [Chitinivibrionales bacterium]|nr:methyltransferase domain-containing protein [Chitinivibrionales bacterium]
MLTERKIGMDDSRTSDLRTVCPSCGGEVRKGFHTVTGAPANSVLNIASREQAQSFPRGDIDLSVCTDCGFISNRAFEPKLVSYTTGYEATQAYSPTFSTFARRQAEKLIDDFSLPGKSVVEIGCGTGEFLALLCSLGDNRGVGYDPAYVPGRLNAAVQDRVRVVKDFYSETADTAGADLILCRMTLEHIWDTRAFVAMVRRTISSPQQRVFFQVPNGARVIGDCAFEDVYYEHCSYFMEDSLRRLFGACGFEVLGTETGYDEQYLMLHARAAEQAGEGGDAGAVADVLAMATDFEQRYREKREQWQKRLGGLRDADKRGVIWGAGSKAVSFLTSIEPGQEIVAGVDINPHRQGTFMAGSGHEIVGPDTLGEIKPDFVIIMNDVYREEIEQTLRDIGIAPAVMTIHEPGEVSV